MPYTYLIGWSKHNKYYYGVRWANTSSPQEDLWNNYFTSSKRVEKFRSKFGEPDIVQIRRTFNNSESARIWETSVIKKMDMVKSNMWLNLSDREKFYHEGPRGKFSAEHRKKLSDARKGRKISKEHAKKLHEGRKRSKNSPEHTAAVVKSRIGTKHTEEAKRKMSETRLNNPNRFELASKAGKISAQRRQKKKI